MSAGLVAASAREMSMAEHRSARASWRKIRIHHGSGQVDIHSLGSHLHHRVRGRRMETSIRAMFRQEAM